MKSRGVSEMTFEEAQALIQRTTRIVGFTGAGISTESGIPDFRSPTGIWSTNRIVEYGEFVRHYEARVEYWRQKVAMWPEIRDAAPNAGHLAFVELERQGRLQALVTQNIDGLHQKAGSTQVIELHGTTREVECLRCEARTTMEEAVTRVLGGELAPVCLSCGGNLKPATVSFGQGLPAQDFESAVAACRTCEVMIVAGSSLVVQPACQLPEIAKRHGATLLLLNRTTTPLDPLADLVLHDTIGEVLPRLVGQG
jgi:NAD-dependent deacetylase